MAKAKTIREFLPKEEIAVLVQAKIPESFFDKVNKQRRADKVTWHDLIVASFEKYLSESKEQNAG